MKLQKLIQYLNQETKKELNTAQQIILEECWEFDKSYSDIAEKYRYSKAHVKKEGHSLWRLLSTVLERTVTKKTFRCVI